MEFREYFMVIIAAAVMAGSLYQAGGVDVLENRQVELELFAKWTKLHKKAYSSPAEFIYRFTIFQKTVEEVKDHQQKNSATYTIGINKFADMTLEEFLAKHTGYSFSSEPRRVEILQGNEPEEVDWVSMGVVNPVKDQRHCGSCWAFSAIASLESSRAIAGAPLLQLSEQQLVDCGTIYGLHGCNGGKMQNAFSYLIDYGTMSEYRYPYAGRDQSCRYKASEVEFKAEDFKEVQTQNEQQMRLAVSGHVMSVGIDAGGIMKYTGGVFNGKCGLGLNHGVAIVGYGVEDGLRYWTVRNSWGVSYGEDGYVRMAMIDPNGTGICGINIDPSYVISPAE